MWGQADGDVARGNWYPNTTLTPLTPVAYRINGSIDTHGESETTERKEWRTVYVFVCVFVRERVMHHWLCAFCVLLFTNVCVLLFLQKSQNSGSSLYSCVCVDEVKKVKSVCVWECDFFSLPHIALYVSSDLVPVCVWRYKLLQPGSDVLYTGLYNRLMSSTSTSVWHNVTGTYLLCYRDIYWS